MFNSESFASCFRYLIPSSVSWAITENFLSDIRTFVRLMSATIPIKLANSISLLAPNNEFRNVDHMHSDARPGRGIKAAFHHLEFA
jgi:hypothetical protein